MNGEEARALGLRAAACHGWRWMCGMVAERNDGQRTRLIGEPYSMVWDGAPTDVSGGRWLMDSRWWPDLRDPATMGAALAVWQAHPGHTHRCPCPVLTYAACYGLTDRRTIVALVEAMGAPAARVQP